MFNCVFVTFLCGILGKVWYLIVLIPDLCRLSYLGILRSIFIFSKVYTFSRKTIIQNKVTMYDQDLPQSQTAHPWHREEEPPNNHETRGRQTKQNNRLSLPHQGDCKTRMDIK